MTFNEYMKTQYGIGEPIYLSKIKFLNYSRSWIFKQLKKMVESGELRRFDTGIYYFPQKMSYGEASLNPRTVVEKRFLSDGNEVYGYVAGISLLNMVGLTTQVPNLLEVVSNNETTRVRDIQVGNQRVRARRSRTTVTSENVKTLQFLDLMNVMDPKNIDETEKYMLNKYIKTAGVNKEEVMKYVGFFPAKAMKNMIESGTAYELA
ncbi:MAG: DUF6088 family protein [Lachnospiraceae bacterium]|jgi:hypothetical protein|nr:DUF6088 family protein [Lachnospiraceae bacterium]